jgi:hypothetical protein
MVIEQMPVRLGAENVAVLVDQPCGDGHEVEPVLTPCFFA